MSTTSTSKIVESSSLKMVKKLIEFMRTKNLLQLRDNDLSLFYKHFKLDTGSFKVKFIADNPQAGLTFDKTTKIFHLATSAAQNTSNNLSADVAVAAPAPPTSQPPLPPRQPPLLPSPSQTRPNFEVEYVDEQTSMTIALNAISSEAVIALDLEMDNGADICLIQVGVKKDGRRIVYLFDVLEFSDIMEPENLPRILVDTNVIKVIHDGRQDYLRLQSEYNIEMAAIFDTQVACTKLQNKNPRLQIGLNKMLRLFKVPFQNDTKDDVDHRAWTNRPLTDRQRSYAAQDVAYLLDAYESMRMTTQVRDSIIAMSKARIPKPESEEAREASPVGVLAKYPTPTRLFLSFTSSGEAIVGSECFPPVENLSADAQTQDKSERQLLYDVLPEFIRRACQQREASNGVMDSATELIVDVGRVPFLRLMMSQSDDGDSPSIATISHLSRDEIRQNDIDDILNRVRLESFSNDNRCGLSGTLHRISRKVNRQGKTIGFTMRIGRMVPGSTSMIADLLASKKSILLIGCPGVGKTTLLREIARVISNGGDAVEIIDTSNEIAGEGDVPHPSIGAARRMMVADRRQQHDVMIEAVQNHMPQCLVIDEIGTRKEARAASDIRHRGIRLIGTAHGTELRQLVENPELNVLLGGVHTVIIGDDEAQRRKVRSKSVQERMGPCAFDCAIELRSLHAWVIHHDLALSVDRLLSHQPDLPLEVRRMTPDRRMTVEKTSSFQVHPPAISQEAE